MNIKNGSNGDKEIYDTESLNPQIKTNIPWYHEDRGSIILLFLLYILQGIPLGISGSIPMLLAAKEVGYHDQAVFSFVFWPFSLKLLWAPIVDSVYIKSFGRRKSWMIPAQYGIAFVMCLLSYKMDNLLSGQINVKFLTACFFLLNFGAATQDIAVDGWALTMLSKRNVGLASTCNSVGQTAGYFLGYVLFLALESETFCNKYLRTHPEVGGVITLAGFLRFWAIVFVVVTTLVLLFKKEKSSKEEEELSVFKTYRLLWHIICLPSVTQYVIILLTSKVGFALESIVGLKLIEYGVKRETFALLAVPLTPVQIALPLLISKYTSGPQPMSIFLKAMVYRLLMGVILVGVVYFTPYCADKNGDFPLSYFAIVLIIYSLHQVTLYCMFVSQMAFNAKISDPAIGGTYMTLLNTVANLGGKFKQIMIKFK